MAGEEQTPAPARTRPRCRTCGEPRKGHPIRCPLLPKPAPAPAPLNPPTPPRIVRVNHNYAYVGTRIESGEGVVYNANLLQEAQTPTRQHQAQITEEEEEDNVQLLDGPPYPSSSNDHRLSEDHQENEREGSDESGEDERDNSQGYGDKPGKLKFTVWRSQADADRDGIIGGRHVFRPAQKGWDYAFECDGRKLKKEKRGGMGFEWALLCIVGIGAMIFVVWRRSIMQMEENDVGLAAKYNLRTF
ncbi:hypothetical protein BC629DRAFT_719013 [Irpex lacteus]|nr:hypothetical protein BC629DRAFT_719013 [Irpex lacteus]